ncbi:MAG TPA: TauD/TfdA family dioxygenase [Casimicrobiaceae bacterium]|nr:TauD/TfdA family dioxygenase [Casimicrobiaceae bacterium]
MSLTITPLTGTIGAEAKGVDLSKPVDDATRRTLYDAWIKYAVLVIRDQQLTPLQFAAAARLFGPLLEQQVKQFTLAEHPEVGTISSRDLPMVDGKLKVRGEQYHTDHSNFEAPPKATMLHAVSLPSFGGDTQFVDVRAAFDDLPEERRRALVKLRSPHVYESSKSPRKMAALSAQERAKIPQTVQPLVIRHPENGRSALYLNTARMEGIDGLPPDEAFKLIDELYAHATQSKYEYRHKWRPGDMVIWDNRSVMHQANADFDPTEYRFLYRVMLQGAPLQPATA